ncbi:hypothetical protein ACRE_038040 [Hapsidospora chrysogenum ATCC 11550]|uniref:Extracellular membrane protein CFEM domain-containing protein n=1 Tax=Hapsidospora chrysogenum (strain ATCC 11550 / CBS 779.69 / DSM 880 / IAM 14645 / JCM 23072 / IMI 49137) TaxID=857340 RepID=A0A086T7M9_HAPC1|nr:hypothetical protein ACRE_038040 [Hapsidospora chrysogenum ATCC 11550]
MKFSSLILMALPAVALAKPAPTSSTTSSAPQPTGPPDPDLSICEKEAGSYAEYCPRCAPQCADREGDVYEMCLNSVFMTINSIQSQCWQHGGIDCRNQAVDRVCGPRE